MVEGKKKKSVTETTPLPENANVGEILKSARMAKNMSVDDVSRVINIRAVQIRALEENNTEALPGMTYAVGFVRSYGKFLGLNTVALVDRFKAEHTQEVAESKLVFPIPVTENRMPDPVTIWTGVALAMAALMLWGIYTNVHGSDEKAAEQVPPAPVVETTAAVPAAQPAVASADTAQQAQAPVVTDTATTAAPFAQPAVITSPDASGEVPPAKIDPVPQQPVQPATTEVGVMAAVPPVQEGTAKVDAAAPVTSEAPVQADKPVVKPMKRPVIKPVVKTEVRDDAQDDGTEAEDAVIHVRNGKSRITLRANQASWIQITDTNGEVVYRKVLRPGERYDVPDQPGLSLVTANAGGLDISVDGHVMQSLGKPGEIVRGIILDAAEFKKSRNKARN